MQPRIRASWDVRYETPLEQQRLLLAPSLNGGQDGALYLIAPGAPERSILYQAQRHAPAGSAHAAAGSSRRDEAYLELLQRWIAALPVTQ